MSVEDTAEAICSMQVFGARKKSYIWRIELMDEDPKTIDIDLRQESSERLNTELVWYSDHVKVS